MNLSPPLARVAPPVALDPNLCAGRPGTWVDNKATMAPLAVPARTPGMFSSFAPAAPALFANANTCAPGASIDLATDAIGKARRAPLRPPPVDVSVAVMEANSSHVQSQHFEIPHGMDPRAPCGFWDVGYTFQCGVHPGGPPRWERLNNTGQGQGD